MQPVSLIVLGKVTTDIVISGFQAMPEPGHGTKAESIRFSPGGKARNIADMAAALMPDKVVAIIAKTAADEQGLWRIPLDALEKAGVDTRFVTVAKGASPSMTAVLVDKQGTNRLIGASGIAATFGQSDIEHASELFRSSQSTQGIVAITGNCPPDAALYTANLAVEHNLKVVFDPGGADDLMVIAKVLGPNIHLFKPNEHEAKAITGVAVSNLASAQTAAAKFLTAGVQNVLITAGANGAYLFSDKVHEHLPAPKLEAGEVRDETGCGDQTLAALCAYLLDGKSLQAAAELALIAGTLQFYRAGIQPVSRKEIEAEYNHH